jgi:hypothetical protein
MPNKDYLEYTQSNLKVKQNNKDPFVVKAAPFFRDHKTKVYENYL